MSDDADDVEKPESDGGMASDTTEEPSRDTTDSDKTVPRVELSLRDLSVSVAGRSDDNLDTVEQSALALMEHLVEKTKSLEEDRDDYGLT